MNKSMDKKLGKKINNVSKGSVVVIGAGAAGLLAAIKASMEGYSVTILEKNSKPGKKLLMTGNGKCNLTNEFMSKECFNCTNPDFPMKVIEQFDKDKTLLFFKTLGLVYKNKRGYYYPNSEQASSVVNLLRNECDFRYIHTIYEADVTSVIKQNDTFVINYNNDKNCKIICDKVIITTGGKTYTKTGSNGFGYELAKRFGHNIIDLTPALTGLVCEEKCFKDLAGVRINGTINICDNNEIVNKDTGEIQLTNYGVSGIPVFQVSRHVIKRLNQGNKSVKGFMDFAPEFDFEEFVTFMSDRYKNFHGRSIMQCLETFINDKVARVILKVCGISLDYKVNHLDKEMIYKLCKAIKHFEFTVIGYNDFENAQVTAGGVDTNEINPCNMESKLVKGLYFAGEIVDVDGICGGYNLQWAWSSAYVAGSLK